MSNVDINLAEIEANLLSRSLTPDDAPLLINAINELRAKQLSGNNLSDDELRIGIRLIAEMRALRAGKTAEDKANAKVIFNQPLGELF